VLLELNDVWLDVNRATVESELLEDVTLTLVELELLLLEDEELMEDWELVELLELDFSETSVPVAGSNSLASSKNSSVTRNP